MRPQTHFLQLIRLGHLVLGGKNLQAIVAQVPHLPQARGGRDNGLIYAVKYLLTALDL